MSGARHYPVSRPSIGPRERALVLDTLETNQLTLGPMVARFEAALAAALGVPHAVAVANGTVALHLALAACDVQPGDEVLVPDLTFVATVNAVAYTGATPVLVDIRPDTWEIDLEDAARKVCRRTRAIVPVHLYGMPCDMTAINQFADAHGLFVVEDAAEGLGGSWAGRPCGSHGDCGTFSFYGNKIVTSGEGGAVVTSERVIAERLRLLRGQGMDPARRYFHSEVGFNYRLTDLQAAVGVGQLERLSELLAARRRVFKTYVDSLAPRMRVEFYGIDPASAPWLFTVLLPAWADRTTVMSLLAAHGIDTRPTFVPLHRLPMYERPDAQFPVACDVGDRGLSLPTYPDLTEEDVRWISDRVLDVLEIAQHAA